jgi:hypothetical protein
MLDLQNLQNYREDNRIEAKQALGGLPESIWETYSAFANACGGVILLGVEELPDKRLHALDLLDPKWLLEDLRAGLNDPERVSVNILTEEDIQIHTVEGKQIVTVTVPGAPAALRPVYVRQDGRWIAFVRRGEGDFRATEEEIARMYRQREAALNLRDWKTGLDAYLKAHYRPEKLHRRAVSFQSLRETDCAPMAGVMEAAKKASVPGGLRERLRQTDAGFSETLLKLIDQSGRKDSEIYTRANLSRQHFSKIRNNPLYRPTKPTALALAIALELDLGQTRDLIGRAGYALTGSSKFDVIVMYFLEAGCYDLGIINEALYEYDQSLLGM